MSQYQQDELAQLFAQNMTFSQPLPQHPSTPDKQFVNQSTTYRPTYYMSQHYTPPYYQYQSPAEESTTRADSPLAVPEENLELTLRQHDIDPTSLSPSQVKLFINADYEQRLRLLELWRISPPDPRNADWPFTNMQQEEETARIRYEERMRSHEQQNSTIAVAEEEAEPYITSGYSSHRHSDPVYSSTLGLWQSPENARSIQQMEDSYGAFEQARSFEKLQAMNHQIEAARMGSADDDMVM